MAVQATAALGFLGHPESDEVLLRLVRTSDGATAEAALRALGRLARLTPNGERGFAALAHDPPPGVKSESIQNVLVQVRNGGGFRRLGFLLDVAALTRKTWVEIGLDAEPLVGSPPAVVAVRAPPCVRMGHAPWLQGQLTWSGLTISLGATDRSPCGRGGSGYLSEPNPIDPAHRWFVADTRIPEKRNFAAQHATHVLVAATQGSPRAIARVPDSLLAVRAVSRNLVFIVTEDRAVAVGPTGMRGDACPPRESP